jgi:hypothetical protein
MDWVQHVRRRYRNRRLAFYGSVVILLVTWLGLSAVGILAWTLCFHRLPPPLWSLGAFVSLGTALTASFSRVILVPPSSKRSPEEIAAAAFFSGRTVGPDDEVFRAKNDE